MFLCYLLYLVFDRMHLRNCHCCTLSFYHLVLLLYFTCYTLRYYVLSTHFWHWYLHWSWSPYHHPWSYWLQSTGLVNDSESIVQCSLVVVVRYLTPVVLLSSIRFCTHLTLLCCLLYSLCNTFARSLWFPLIFTSICCRYLSTLAMWLPHLVSSIDHL